MITLLAVVDYLKLGLLFYTIIGDYLQLGFLSYMILVDYVKLELHNYSWLSKMGGLFSIHFDYNTLSTIFYYIE